MEKNWISVHTFYYSNLNPFFLDCVKPLVAELRTRGLIQRYFFIRYWQEGMHFRLRLLPAQGVEQAAITRLLEPALATYLKRYPALYEPDFTRLASFHREMFIAEYGEEKWMETYGADGRMPVRANNTFHYIEYEPEYYRYGGIDGVEVAEWHFEQSSDIVLRLLDEVNLRVRTILLGMSIQLMLPLCYAFLDNDQAVIDFLEQYMHFWQKLYTQKKDFAAFERRYLSMKADLQPRITEIKGYIHDDTASKLTTIERRLDQAYTRTAPPY